MKKRLDQFQYGRETLIGDGGFAEVYRALDTGDGREVALKILKPNFEFDTYAVDAFFRDAQIGRNLNHTNIIKIYALGNTIEKPFFFSMEFCKDGDLRKMIQQHGPMKVKSVLEHADKLSDALAYVHAAGLFHRDIKASNVLFRDRSSPVLTDFGIAMDEAEMENILRTHPNVGAPPYMSPEVWERKSYDARSDLYSFGVLLYYSMTGQMPFSGKSPDEYKRMHLFAPPTPPSRYNPAITRSLEGIILSLLEKHAGNRIPTAGELRALLKSEYETAYAMEAPMQMVNVVVYLGPTSRGGISVSQFPYRIGTKEGEQNGVRNDLVLTVKDATVSRFHAFIDKVEGGFAFVDQSRNGSLVNGKPVKNQRVMLGRENYVVLGRETKMVIRLEERRYETTQEIAPSQTGKALIFLGIGLLVLTLLLYLLFRT